jgi:hypothetical protein
MEPFKGANNIEKINQKKNYNPNSVCLLMDGNVIATRNF